MNKRRDFLRHATLAAIPQSFAATPFEDLIAKVARRQLLPDTYPEAEIWGYDGLGPEIRVTQGDRVRRRFRNEVPDPVRFTGTESGSTTRWMAFQG